MKHMILMALSLLLTACTHQSEQFDTILDDAGNPHYTMKMQDDNKGKNYFAQKRPPTGQKLFIFDPNEDAWAAYDANGQLVKTGSASGGRNSCPNDKSKSCRTVTGVFHVFDKKGPDCRSSEFPVSTHGGAKMPYCMHFHNGYAIHAAYDVPNYNASHGCIRVLPGAAKWLNENFINIGTEVVVRPYDTTDAKPLA